MYKYYTQGAYIMKGKTRCPKCKHEFIVDVPAGVEKYNVVCTNCGYSFTIVTEGSKKLEEWRWEHHGGPRKTILPSLANVTKRPMIASLLLFIVSIFGVITAIVLVSNPSSLGRLFTPFGSYVMDILYSYAVVWFILLLIFSGFAMVGSYSCYRKKPMILSLVGAVCGIFTFGLVIIGPILSVIALFLIISSRNEFENGLYGKEF